MVGQKEFRKEFKQGDIQVSWPAEHVAQCELQKPPNNHFSIELLRDLADIYAELGSNHDCRALVLCAQGKHFCAGADFGATESGDEPNDPGIGNPLYDQAVRLFQAPFPVVAAVQGSAIGGGLGLAVSADFRIGCEHTRFSANFVKIGFAPGFGLTHTLPRLVGVQHAANMMLTGRRIKGDEALGIGLLDQLVSADEVRTTALALASEIATGAPLGLRETLAQLRGDLAECVRRATDVEGAVQAKLQKTNDFREGVLAVAQRRPGNFKGN